MDVDPLGVFPLELPEAPSISITDAWAESRAKGPTESLPSIHHSCYEIAQKLLSNNSAPDDDSCILEGFLHLFFDVLLVRFVLFFQPRRSLRHPLPAIAQLAFPPKLLQRFLRDFVGSTARRLADAPACVYVDAKKKLIWRNCIFARVMSGFVMREEVRLQAAAAAHIARKGHYWGIIDAAASGDVADVLSHLITHANSVNKRGV